MNIQTHINKIPLENIKCIQGYTSRMVCINPSCKQPAFLCMKENCENCSEKHNNCRSYWLKTLAGKINEKKKKISDSTMSGFEEILSKLQGIKQRVDQETKSIQKLMKYYGYSSKQTNFVQKIENGYYQKIYGEEIKNILKQIQIQKRIRASRQQVQSLWTRIQKSLDMAFNRFYDDLSNVQPYISSSISDDYDTKVWEQHFKKKVKAYEKIYSATKSKFNVQTFFQRVSKHSATLILAKTNDDRIFGGFSKVKWRRNRVEDKNGQCFIFCVTDKRVFKCRQWCSNAISTENYAPVFGQRQFFIGNKSNINKSLFRPGRQYGQLLSQIQLKQLTGSQEGQINIVNWEVFSVIFMK